MKILINNYSFNKVAKTVTLTDYATIELKNVLLITNVDTNTIIYNFASLTKGGTVATNVLTLDFDTNIPAMSNADKLQIWYYDTNVASLGTVTVTNPTANPETGLATSANQTNGSQQTNIYGSITKVSITATSAGDTTIITPAAGKKIRLFKFSYSADGNNVLGTVAGLKFGANAAIDKQWLDPKQPYADGLTMRYYDGAINEALKVSLSVAVSTGVYVNVAFQEI